MFELEIDFDFEKLGEGSRAFNDQETANLAKAVDKFCGKVFGMVERVDWFIQQ